MHRVLGYEKAEKAKHTLKILKVLCFLFIIHVDTVVKNDKGAAAEQVSDVAREHIIDSRAF
jgi:hypothetical protein